MPSWPGARSAWAIAAGDVTRNVVSDEPLVDGSVLPSQKATSKGRSGSARASSSRSGAGREKAMARNLSSRGPQSVVRAAAGCFAASGARPRRSLRHRPQVPVGLLATQHADDALDDVLAVDALAIGDGVDDAALALDELGHRLVDRVGRQQVPGRDGVGL